MEEQCKCIRVALNVGRQEWTDVSHDTEEDGELVVVALVEVSDRLDIHFAERRSVTEIQHILLQLEPVGLII